MKNGILGAVSLIVSFSVIIVSLSVLSSTNLVFRRIMDQKLRISLICVSACLHDMFTI